MLATCVAPLTLARGSYVGAGSTVTRDVPADSLAISRARQYVLTALRVVFFVLVLGLLLRPVLALTIEGSIRRSLVLLLDDSSSMQIRDPRVDTADQKRAAIAKDEEEKRPPPAVVWAMAE